MTINDQIRDEKLQYHINVEAAKISALSSGEIHKYEYPTGEAILPSNRQQIIEQARFTYSALGKAFEKQIKTIEDQGQKQVAALNTLKSNNQLTIEDVIPKNALNNDEAKKELDKIKEIEKNVDREKLIYETSEYTYSFKNYKTTKTFGRDIYEGKITIEEANEYQTDLLTEIRNFRANVKPRSQKEKQEKEIVLKNLYNLFEDREKILHAFESKIFLTKSKGSGILSPDHSKLKVLTPKQMLQRLPIALAQVKASHNSESLLNEISKLFILCISLKKLPKNCTITLLNQFSKVLRYV